MTYSKLSNEARELVHYIENNEQALRAINEAVESPRLNLDSYIKQCKINYKALNANVDDYIFSESDLKQVKSYFLNHNTVTA